MSRPTQATIDLQALRDNFALAQSLAPEAQTMPMVKANAYGHGMLEVAQALADMAPAFGVACIEEALELRDAGITQPILLLEGTFSADEVNTAALKGFWLMVENHPQKEAIINADIAQQVQVWVGIDTGMHRLGFAPKDVAEVYQTLSESRNVNEQIIVATHFACAEDFDSEFTDKQLETFCKTVADFDSVKTSLANSASILGRPNTHKDWNRPGYMIYGASPFDQPQENADKLKPVMTLTSAVISVRKIDTGEAVGYSEKWRAEHPSTIATIGIGYGDGYPRTAPYGTPVLVNGIECPLVGSVSMDMISVDVTDLQEVNIGDPVELWGKQLAVNRVAASCGTLGYELLTRMPLRVPRTYK
ncbi:MAG: alanine racemase [Oceanospirillaceae bacterium]|nr:alanine racemase [Oceanospirillaceae bacterium]